MKDLPNHADELKKLILGLQRSESALQLENEILREQLRLARLAKYAPSSEKAKGGRQYEFFDEAELDQAMEDEEEKLRKLRVQGHERNQPKRKPLPAELPREKVVIELKGEERRCSCGCEMDEIGEEVSEKLDIEPAKAKVLQIIRKKYACRSCDSAPKRAPLPLEAIPKSVASAGFLAWIVVSKFLDHLPLYRQVEMLSRYGLEMSRTTLSMWVIRCGELIQPLLNLIWDELLSEDTLQMDETHVQVLKEPGKKPTTKSYMWTAARAGPRPAVIFEYDPTRSGQVPKRLLEGYRGYLQVDGYSGYDPVCREAGIRRVGCAYHIRRKFDQVVKAAEKAKYKGAAKKALKYFEELFAVEEEARANGYSPDERKALRMEKAKPILDEMKPWLGEIRGKYPPKTGIGRAVQYAVNEWENFVRYLEDGRLEIGTIFIENQIRPFALGRRNWLFADTVRGARASAALYSLLCTAKANGLNPYDYMKRVFKEIPSAQTIGDYERLLPWNVDQAVSKTTVSETVGLTLENQENGDLSLSQKSS